MAVSFAVNSEAGLKKLDQYLLTRSYITGYVLCSSLPSVLKSRTYNLHCNDLSLVTKLPRMTCLSILHSLLLLRPSTSTHQGGSVTSMLL
jgi:hypothetical protein